MKVKKTERGWAGHFICSNYCYFRRNTLLEYEDIKIIVSTVGNMFTPLAKKGIREEIGCDRYYETMAFHSDINDKKYNDIDVSKQLYFDSEWSLDNSANDNDANNMHENVVNELIEKLENGVIK